METKKLYLNGCWCDAGKALDVANPADGTLVGRIATADRTTVNRALHDAYVAWPAWRRLPGRDRAAILLRIAAALERRSGEIARTMTLENGKPLAQSRGEVAMSVDHLRWFAGEAG